MPVTVRDATVDDAPLIAEFNRRLALETEDFELDPQRVLGGVRAIFDDPSRGRYWVAECDGAVAGQIMVTTEWSDWRNGNFWWIQSVYVSAERRGLGVFQRLFEHVERLARQTEGVRGLRLYVDESNARALKVYERLGMVDSGYRLLETPFTAHRVKRHA